jgi:hypothetical protein
MATKKKAESRRIVIREEWLDWLVDRTNLLDDLTMKGLTETWFKRLQLLDRQERKINQDMDDFGFAFDAETAKRATSAAVAKVAPKTATPAKKVAKKRAR